MFRRALFGVTSDIELESKMQLEKANFTQVTPDVLKSCIKVCADILRPLFVWGHPGIGKSDIVRQTAKDLNAFLFDIRASQLDAVDTRGIPYVTKEQLTAWAIPSLFPTADFAKQFEIVFIFLDELNNAPPSVQAALYQLILDRKLGDYVLPDNVIVIAAGNLETDRGATHRMATPLADRFFHVELLVDPTAWEKWALQNDIHTACIAYVRWRQEHLHDWQAKSPSKAQATPRGWEYVSDAVKSCETNAINGAVEAALISGKLGEAVGAEFIGFLPIYRNLQDPDAVILAPDQAKIDSDPATNYALCGALAARATDQNIDRILTYAQRLNDDPGTGPEFMTLLVRQCAVKNPSIQTTRGFIQWASNNKDVLIS